MQPYYTIMRLPGEAEAEFIQMLPFTPRRKDNLASWLVARSDGEHYGRLAVFEFPKQSLVFGPKQIVGRISQDQIDLAADHAVESAGIAGDLGNDDGHPDRGVADLRSTAVSPGTERPHPRSCSASSSPTKIAS